MAENTGETTMTQELKQYKEAIPTAATNPDLALAQTATQRIPSLTDRIRAIGKLIGQSSSPAKKEES